MNKEMKVGDVVIVKNPHLTQLACGSGMYTHAIVANLKPFILISEEGDMLWSKVNPDELIPLCQVHPDILKVVMNRLDRSGY